MGLYRTDYEIHHNPFYKAVAQMDYSGKTVLIYFREKQNQLVVYGVCFRKGRPGLRYIYHNDHIIVLYYKQRLL